MKKTQTDRLTKQHRKNKGVEGIFSDTAKKHDDSVKAVSVTIFHELKSIFPYLEFRYREKIEKSEINQKLNAIDDRLGVTLFVDSASIRPDGGIIEVADQENAWRIVMVSEAKHQGKDIKNITKGILVGKNKNQDLMVAGNAIERSHKNINEIRNMMVAEAHFPYVLFLQGSNFMTESLSVARPDGRVVELSFNAGSLNRIDRLTASNYSQLINQNCCENVIVQANGQEVMLQSVSIYAKATEWSGEEMKPIMMDIAKTSLKVLRLIGDGE